MYSRYIGFDPSYTCFGVAEINTKEKIIRLNSFKLSPGSKKLQLITWAAINIVTDIKDYLDLKEGYYISQESPAPRAPGSSLPMLWVLGSILYRDMGSMSNYERYSLYNVMAMRTLHSNKKHTKKDTMVLVDKIINIFKANGYSVIYEKKYDDGMADAFIYSLLGYIKFNDTDITKQVLTEVPTLFKIKEEIVE